MSQMMKSYLSWFPKSRSIATQLHAEGMASVASIVLVLQAQKQWLLVSPQLCNQIQDMDDDSEDTY